MQVVGLVSATTSSILPTEYEDNYQYFSYEYTLNFSVDDNILVFILDRFDVEYMTETLEEYPELYQELDGFTFYKNNISEFPSTFPSITTMLTQHYYSADLTYEEYWEEAWSQYSVIDTLRENGYSTCLFIDKLSTYGNHKEISNRTDNIKAGRPKLNIEGMLSVTSKLTLGRIAPYLLKNTILRTIDATFGNRLYTITAINPFEVQQPLVGKDSDLRLYEYLSQNNLSANEGKKMFKFIHLNCSHADLNKKVTTGGYRYNVEDGTIEMDGNYIDSTRACFAILNMYFSKMKELGVYNNSTIIMLGDHGAQFNGKVTAALLIKPKNAIGELRTNANAELSNKYLGASILEAANIPHEEMGLSYFDILGGKTPPARYFYRYNSWWDQIARVGGSARIGLKDIYKVSGDANDPNNWEKITE